MKFCGLADVTNHCAARLYINTGSHALSITAKKSVKLLYSIREARNRDIGLLMENFNLEGVA